MKYSLKIFFRNRETLFWTIMFPIALLFLLSNSFSGGTTIKLYSDNEQIVDFFNRDNIEIVRVSEPVESLKNKEIDVYVDDHGDVYSYKADVKANIIKTNMDIWKRFQYDPIASMNVMERMKNSKSGFTNFGFNQMLFAVLVMTAFYSAYGALDVAANLNLKTSYLAVRTLASPKSRLAILLESSVSGILTSFLPIISSSLFAIYVIGFNGFTNVWGSFALLFVALLYGFGFGLFLGMTNIGMGAANGIIVAYMISMGSMAGMNGPNLTAYLVEHAGILLKLDPLYLVTKNLNMINSFNRLNYAEVGGVLAASIILIVFSAWRLKEKRYDSI